LAWSHLKTNSIHQVSTRNEFVGLKNLKNIFLGGNNPLMNLRHHKMLNSKSLKFTVKVAIIIKA
jgi:hypothetical protein